MPRLNSAADFERLRQQILDRNDGKRVVSVTNGTDGRTRHSDAVVQAFVDEIKKQGLARKIVVKSTGCHGFCEQEPTALLLPEEICYVGVKPEDVPEIVSQTLAKGKLIERLLYEDPVSGQRITRESDIPFYKSQNQIVLGNNRFLDMNTIDDYIALGGYLSLAKALFEMTPGQIIEEVKGSGLRGRGGAGFPTGMKWEFCHNAPGEPKYVIVNCDEGDPGAYMDRSLTEGNPHSVLEGLLIGARAIGAHDGYIYVRAEYPLAVENLETAIRQAEEYGLLGQKILGSDFNLNVHVHRGAGAFVCGEETALIASLEGRIGEPRQRPPFPATSGLWGKPTNINNVETWATVPVIINRGAEWFRKLGTKGSKGTKIFSVVGKLKNTGLVEIPMGMTLRDIVFNIGGGVPGGKEFKAVQTGGPSGGVIPKTLLDTPVDYEKLTKLGSIMGSGGMIVMDEDTCVVDMARYFLNFLAGESCGKCFPCREGIYQMLKILDRICGGNGQEGDIELLEEIAQTVRDFSLCALGRTAPNPVFNTIRYFRSEYEQHVKYKRCPAMVCNEIIFTPCKYNCPVKTDVPAFIAHIAQGKYRKAFDVIRTPNPLPISCGYICHHPCEDRCRSLETGGESISIKALKRFVGDYVMKDGFKPLPKPEVPALEKVAIVGSGPAGLAAAYDLAGLGYQPIVFEASSVIGGNLTMVIPEYRLPRRIIELEIDCIKKAGVTVLTNTPVGPDLTLDDLFNQGYRAILLAVGAHRSLKLDLPSVDTPGVMDAFGFLEAVKIGKKVSLGEKVGVIGGGNAAIDAARTALRTGAKEVSIIYRRSRAEMPAMKREIEAGVEEGVKIVELAAPARIITDNGRLVGIECLTMQLGEYDETGRQRPVPIPGSEFTFGLDNLLLAIGEEPDLSFLPAGHGLEVSPRHTIVTDPETLATGLPGVFAAGDAVTGPSTIADSIASGKLAAVSIDKFLRGEPLVRAYSITAPCLYVEPVERTEEVLELRRFSMPCAPVAERVHNFSLVELGLSEEMARKEASRCLRCDLRYFDNVNKLSEVKETEPVQQETAVIRK